MANSYKTVDVDKPGTMQGIFLQIISSLKTVPAIKIKKNNNNEIPAWRTAPGFLGE